MIASGFLTKWCGFLAGVRNKWMRLMKNSLRKLVLEIEIAG